MQLSDDIKLKLLSRHNAFVKLGKYLEGDEKDFAVFLENVFELEKQLILKGNPNQLQCNLFNQLLTNTSQLKKTIFTQDWQEAIEHFVLSHNSSELLDVLYQLEIGNQDCKKAIEELRTNLVRKAFFEEKDEGSIEYKNISLKFIFSSKISKWSVKQINWKIKKYNGEPVVYGNPVISMGIPDPDGHNFYRKIFALTGSEIKAASIVGIYSLFKNDKECKLLAEKILKNKISENLDVFFTKHTDLIDKYNNWSKKSILEKEFSQESLSFLTKALIYFEKNDQEAYEVLQERFQKLGLKVCEVDKPEGYDFSDEILKGNVIRNKPLVKYYWPPTDKWNILFPGKCKISAGPFPAFLKEIKKLHQAKALKYRNQDFTIIKNLLLHIYLGDKVSQPPILQVYNILRKWLEILAKKKEFRTLEFLCNHAKAFRPFVQIPGIGEKLPDKFILQHKLIPKLAPKQKPGTIVEIRRPAILVPNKKMPLCLPGEYVIAQQHPQLTNLLKLTWESANEFDKYFVTAWKSLVTQEEVQKLVIFLKSILSNISNIKDELWDATCKTINEFNEYHSDKIIFYPHRKITLQQIKELGTNEQFLIKITNKSSLNKAKIISQVPGLKRCILVIGAV